MDTHSVVELDAAACWARLRDEAYGRLAVATEHGPMIYPVNTVVDHGTIVFRTTDGGKLDALRADPRVAFEVDGMSDRRAWSVIVIGSAHEIHSIEDTVAATELGVTPWQVGPKPVYIRVVPTRVTGREFEPIAG